jgi:hypothetical protein
MMSLMSVLSVLTTKLFSIFLLMMNHYSDVDGFETPTYTMLPATSIEVWSVVANDIVKASQHFHYENLIPCTLPPARPIIKTRGQQLAYFYCKPLLIGVYLLLHCIIIVTTAEYIPAKLLSVLTN